MTRPGDAAAQLLLAMEAGLRARRSDAGPDEAERARALLRERFHLVWSAAPQLELEVRGGAVVVEGAPVLTRAEDDQGLIEALDAAGIERIRLNPGVELEEIDVFLAAVDATSRQPGEGPSLLTKLFRADLHHLEYDIRVDAAGPISRPDRPLQTPLVEARPPRPDATPEAVRRTVQQDAETTADSGVVRLESFDSTLYFLDEREIEYLKSAIETEYAQDPALNVLNLLLDVLEGQAETSVREEVIGVLEDFLPVLLAEGRFEAVASLVGGVREATRNAVELSPDHKKMLDQLRTSVSNREALSQLFHALERGAVAPTAQSLDVLLRELRPAAIRQVLAWGTHLSNPETRAAVTEALDSLFTTWPHALSRMMAALDRDAVLAGLDLAGRLKIPDFVEIISEVATHEDPRIRRHLAKTLASIGSAPALRQLLKLAEDPDRDVRVLVFRAFASRPTRSAFGALKRAITEVDLESRGVREKRALFEAFGGCAGPEGVEVLEPILRGKIGFGRGASSHTRACAAIGLGLVATPGALAALRKSEKDRDPVVRSAVGSALNRGGP